MSAKQTNKLKILNDPIYGFIAIPNALIFDLIEHSYFQRLRRISQMGLSYLVYPGAHHTRFHHAIGCMHLMQSAVQTLRSKGGEISEDEATALYIAILLHDIGHGPFSHALEHSIVTGISHEEISLFYMKELNKEFNGQLSLAIEVFEGKYPRKFMHQLISSQLDMDRLDYLKRDSFYSGVAEGNINSERLIAMLYVVDDELVLEEKGIYSAEKFIVGRRLMYWQVYLHKTGVVAEKMLVNLLRRANELAKKGDKLSGSKAFSFFLENQISENNFDFEVLKTFAKLDDYDILSAIKDWISHDDKVLSSLSKMIINRNLLRIELSNDPIDEDYYHSMIDLKKKELEFSDEELSYFIFTDCVQNQAYDSSKSKINIYFKNGVIKDLSEASDQLNIQALTKPVIKYFICYPKK
ncbi:HD domain-containing protein [Flavicella sp.]|uniref:HD domain-containing protein n=1 Tax=Flavicella sp. TaxID=2957742 RepID=UPI00261AEC01|nr:HD domain-containing protein [Flavicella sp.]MDG1805291.1 HD domain-containing protein [Flavicella sp.]